MIGVKLWENPCWLSFRANYIAHHFNHPVYSWIWQRYRLTVPEHVVLYAIGLKDGITAEDIAASSAKPKNTLSRAVKRLLRKGLIFRSEDKADRRRRGLHLTSAGRTIVDETVPVLVEHESAMFAPLSARERETLNGLMTKIILNAGNWPAKIERERMP
jgi:DNA-binding MarR family transcriptional regulator